MASIENPITGDRSGIRALGMLFAALYFMQSLADPGSGILAQPLRSLLNRWGESPSEIALFMALVSLPWSLKPIFGLISDFVPFFGSKRRNYLILSSGLALVGFAVLAGIPVAENDEWFLLFILLLPGIGIAFSDVLIDAVMIEEGQPRGLTGVLQSIQWTAAYAGMLLTGSIGGYFSAIQRPDLAFASCALLSGISLLLVLLVIGDKPTSATNGNTMQAIRAMLSTLKAPGLVSIVLILLIWNLNPLWTTVLYLHFSGPLGFSEQNFGHTISVFSFGAMLASLVYPFYCRKIRLATLLHLSIIAGILANLLYLLVWHIIGAFAVALIAGFAYMTGTMIQMDLAARQTPLVTAATTFALLMAASNFASSVSETVGGELYELTLPLQQMGNPFSENLAYNLVVLLSALLPALCWLLMPRIKRELPQWFEAITT